MEYQRTISVLRNANPSITALARTGALAMDVERLGLRLELEQIQTATRRATSAAPPRKRLRENVYLMQVDLEDNV